MLGKRKYNNQTKCYKIDIFAKLKTGKYYLYVASTDQSKTCKEAKEKYIKNNIKFCKDKDILTRFDRS